MRALLCLWLCACDSPLVATGPHYKYVVSRELIPMTYAEERQYRLDVNGDGYAEENQLGLILVTLAHDGAAFAPLSDRSIDRGETLLLVDLQWPSDGTGNAAGITLFVGANPDPPPCLGDTCRRHLQGDASFEIAEGSFHHDQLVGAVDTERFVTTSGAVDSRPFVTTSGNLVLAVGFLGPPIQLELRRGRVRIDERTDTSLKGVIGGAVTKSDLDTKLLPAWVVFVEQDVARDCSMLDNPPGCGCIYESPGRRWLSYFDSDDDCHVTLEEVATSSAVVSVTSPDLSDGMMSFAIGFEAVPAQFATER